MPGLHDEERPGAFGGLPYECTNDDCWKRGKAVPVPQGNDADCKFCGWTMTAVPLR
jgi:hypothetical protein